MHVPKTSKHTHISTFLALISSVNNVMTLLQAGGLSYIFTATLFQYNERDMVCVLICHLARFWLDPNP